MDTAMFLERVSEMTLWILNHLISALQSARDRLLMQTRVVEVIHDTAAGITIKRSIRLPVAQI